MISTLIRSIPAAFAAILLASCANDSNLAVLPKSALNADAIFGRSTQHEKFDVPSPSQQTVASSLQKPRDRHKMPLYGYNERTRVVRTTAYTHTESDHLIYGRKNAAGTTLRYGPQVRSAAADWSLYPVGTTFRIKGLPYLYVVDDYGSALVGTGTVDLYKPSKDVMNAWGRRNVELTIVRWGSQSRSAEILKDRVHHPHCAQMFASLLRQRRDLTHLAKR
ncbi:MAG: 3D domain-containing protein [Luteolibacter sp.]|jgi:3D (Asp-Asp-Asp) domain-containing protein